MKFIILFLISFSAIAGFPPTTLKGQSQSTATTTFNFQVPNNQATKTATGTLVETGSQNLLSNPGFEHSTVGTDWNVTSGTLTASGSAPFGSFSGTFSGSIANGNIQSLTGSGTAQAGLNCLVSAFVKTASSNVQVCAIHNGTLNTNLCVNVNSSNTWAQYQIPTVCDAVSTVARIRITTSVATTFDADNVYVGINPNISATQLITNWTDYTMQIDGSISNPTIGTTSVNKARWRQVGTDMEIQWTLIQTGAGTAGSGTYLFKLPTGYTIDSSKVNISTDSNLSTVVGVGDFNNSSSKTLNLRVMPYDTTHLSGKFSEATDITSAQSLGGANWRMSFTARVPIVEFASTVPIISTNNQNYPPTAFTPSFPQGFVTVSNESCFKSRRGKFLILDCKFTTSGNPVEARVSLPDSLTIDSSITPSIRPCGSAWRNGGSIPYATLCTGGLSYLTFALTTDYFTATTASNLVSAGQTFGFKAEIPIQGWNNDNVIVGTFAGTPLFSGISSSVDSFAVSYGTTNATTVCSVSPCSYFDTIGSGASSVTRSATGSYSLVFGKTYTKVKCTHNYNPGASASSAYPIRCESCSSVAFTTPRSSDGTLIDSYGTIICYGY